MFHNKLRQKQILTGLLTLSLFVGTPIILDSSVSYFLGEKKDFLSLILFFSDCVVLMTAGALIWHNRAEKQLKPLSKWAYVFPALLILHFMSVVFNYQNLLIPTISIYYLLLLIKAYVLHETQLLKIVEVRNVFEKVLIGMGILQTVLAMGQFALQSNVGLHIFGEQVLGPYIDGVAKIESLNQILIRPYGTFAHPNILGGILVVAFIIQLKRAVSQETSSRLRLITTVCSLLILLTGVILTFSRAAWLAAILGILSFALFAIIGKVKVTSLAYLYRVLLYCAFLSVIMTTILLSVIEPRATLTDSATTERQSYNKAAISTILNYPLFGVGPGQSLLHMQQSLGKNVEPWEVQPVHNYFLLYASELGIPALLLLLFCFIRNIWKAIYNTGDSDHFAYLSVFIAIIPLLLFDHYIYTISTTVTLFWLLSSLYSAD